MDNQDRTERIRLCQSLLDNEGYHFFQSELDRLIDGKSKELDTLQAKGIINESQYQAGLKKGLEIAKHLTENIFMREKSMIQRMMVALGVK